MANIGPNKGRKLRGALCRFAAILIDEAKDLTGCSYAELDDLLGLPDGQAYRYSMYPIRKKTRAPQAGSVQRLENRVAKLLKRQAHKVVIRNNAIHRQAVSALGEDGVIGTPDERPGMRSLDWSDLQLAYEHDWPTYRQLKTSSAVEHYLWQWGVLWDRGTVPWPWSRELLGLPPDALVESFLPSLTQAHMHARAAMMKALAAGILPEMPSHEQLLNEARRYGFPC